MDSSKKWKVDESIQKANLHNLRISYKFQKSKTVINKNELRIKLLKVQYVNTFPVQLDGVMATFKAYFDTISNTF